jgi:phage tail sheath protein FI
VKVAFTVHVDLTGLKQFQAMMDAGLKGNTGPVRDAVRLWAQRYRAAMYERFDVFSAGGGDWAPLARSTVLARTRAPVRRARVRLGAQLARGKITEEQYDRRMGAAIRKVRRTRRAAMDRYALTAGAAAGMSILRDTGTLFMALTPRFVAAPGQLQEDVPYGIEVGFGGPARYPKGAATIADVATFHQFGNPRLPARQILVDVPPEVAEQMTADMEAAIHQVLQGTERL